MQRTRDIDSRTLACDDTEGLSSFLTGRLLESQRFVVAGVQSSDGRNQPVEGNMSPPIGGYLLHEKGRPFKSREGASAGWPGPRRNMSTSRTLRAQTYPPSAINSMPSALAKQLR